MTFEREGSPDAELDVAYLVGAGGAQRAETATFLAGEEAVVVQVGFEDGSVTLIDGDEYDLGGPSSTDLMIVQSTPACVGDSTSPAVTVGAVAVVAVVAAAVGLLLWRRGRTQAARDEAP